MKINLNIKRDVILYIIMSFRQFGGLNYSAKSNIITNQYSNSGNLGITDTLGQPNSKIVSQSHLDMSANSVLHIGRLYFMDGTVQSTAASNTTTAATFPAGIVISGGNISITSTTLGNITGANLITANTVQATTFNGGTFNGTFVGPLTGNVTGNASTATSLAGGASYKIPYQTNTGTTGYIDNASSSGLVLTSNPTNTGYVWSTASSLVGNGALTLTCDHSTAITGTFTANQTGASTIAIALDATSANTASTIVARDITGNFSANLITANLQGTALYASNLAGGFAGSIPVQSAANTTGYLSVGTAGQVLATNGTPTPTWTAAGTSGQVLTSSGAAIPTWTTPNAATVTIASSSTAANFYPTFVSLTSGNLALFVDGGILYNPNTNSLTLSGTANVTSSSINGTGIPLNVSAGGAYISQDLMVNGGNIYGPTNGIGHLFDSNPMSYVYIAGYASNIEIGNGAGIISQSINIGYNDANTQTINIGSTSSNSTQVINIGGAGSGDSGSCTINIGDTTENTSTVYIGGSINFKQNSSGGTQVIEWLNNSGTALGLIYSSTLSNEFAIDMESTLTNGFKIKLSGSDIFTVSTAGACTATSFTSTSDYRIKENTKLLDNTFSIDNLKPVTYRNKLTEKQDIGFIAHELQEEFPYLVTGEKDGENMQSLNYIGLIGVLVKEIQDLKKRVSILENK
jgi:hypothetical protein